MSRFHTHALTLHGHGRPYDLAPHVKVVAAFGFMIGVVATPREAFWAFGAYALVVIGVAVSARIPPLFMASRMVVEIPFILFALFLPFVGVGPRVPVGPLELSIEGIWGAWSILARATLGTATAVLLIATTPVTDVLAGMSRLRVPAALVAIAGFMIRYLEVVFDEAGRMRTAMVARGWHPKARRSLRAAGSMAGALLVRAYERGERVHQAMVARGYDGVMPTLFPPSARAGDWLVGASPAVIAIGVAVLTRTVGS
ncbi:MAG: cobalt ECF transporter T component CbiQ [Acidimicrobiia bacterium]